MIFLGTGASEAIPCVFCSCPVCESARTLKGKNIRTRSSLLIDSHHMIDFSPDIFKQCLDCNISLSNLHSIFFTHTHDDHLDLSELITVTSSTPWPNHKIKLYLSKSATSHLQSRIDYYIQQFGTYTEQYFSHYKLCTLEPFTTYSIDALLVTPILSSHSSYGPSELGLNYIIETETNHKFLYGCDTGWYSDETWCFLAHYTLDCVILECTYGTSAIPLPPLAPEHLNYTNMVSMLHKLYDLKCISLNTPIYLTHISHLVPLTHEAFSLELKKLPYNIHLAYDGLSI